MAVAGKMLGGISFGFIGSALYKSLGLFAVLSVLNFFSMRNETLFWFGTAFGSVLLILSFILLFRIDLFEALILSLVNSFVIVGLAALMTFTLVHFVSQMGDSVPRDEAGVGSPLTPNIVPAANGTVTPLPVAENANPVAQQAADIVKPAMPAAAEAVKPATPPVAETVKPAAPRPVDAVKPAAAPPAEAAKPGAAPAQQNAPSEVLMQYGPG
jgi:hypothetical protein